MLGSPHSLYLAFTQRKVFHGSSINLKLPIVRESDFRIAKSKFEARRNKLRTPGKNLAKDRRRFASEQ